MNSNWTLASSYGTAFVSPSFNYLYALSNTYAYGNPNLKPEKSKNIEASLRYRDDSGAISLTIFQNKIDVSQFLDVADIAISTSTYEGMPLSLLEYGLANLPLVVTNVGQNSKFLKNGSAAIRQNIVPTKEGKAACENPCIRSRHKTHRCSGER